MTTLSQSLSVSVVVPVYNSAETLPELVHRLCATLRPRCSALEIILVNDGSRDASWPTIVELGRKHAEVRGLRLMRNYGQHNALLIGIRSARHEVIVTLDDDLQHPPESIPDLLERLSGAPLVYGMPIELHHTCWRNLTARLAKRMMASFMGMDAMTATSPFRAFKTGLRQAFVGYNGPFVDLDALLEWATPAGDCVPVPFQERRVGHSAYTLRKLMKHTLDMITNFSVVPLRLANYLGFAMTIFGLLVLVYVVGRVILTGSGVPGFPFLASIVAIFSGTQLFSLGIIGEYIIRIHFRVMGRPTAVVQAECRSGAETAAGKAGG